MKDRSGRSLAVAVVALLFGAGIGAWAVASVNDPSRTVVEPIELQREAGGSPRNEDAKAAKEGDKRRGRDGKDAGKPKKDPAKGSGTVESGSEAPPEPAPPPPGDADPAPAPAPAPAGGRDDDDADDDGDDGDDDDYSGPGGDDTDGGTTADD